MKTSLIVDDSRVVRMVIRKILHNLSFQIREAENGQEAVTACQQEMPEVIFLDWNMPVMTGIEFLNHLRTKMPGGDQPKVILCSTENDFAHIQQAIGSGADEYIMKPFDSEIIEAKLQQVGVL